MNSEKSIRQELEQLEILQIITTVYAQLAALWMDKARTSVVESREFLAEMHELFITVFSSYEQEVRSLSKKRHFSKTGKITFISHNGKDVSVFVSANTGFFGEIIEKTFRNFIEHVRATNDEVVIIGRQGMSLFLAEEPTRPYTYFELSDEKIEPDRMVQLMRHLVQYQHIQIFYGKFQSFLSQEPTVFMLSADPYGDLKPDQKKKHYLFEPSIEEILIFFEKQIFSSIFEQTIRESQLAKFASRLMVMDRAGENIKERVKLVEQSKRSLSHRLANQKQLNTFASMSLWSR